MPRTILAEEKRPEFMKTENLYIKNLKNFISGEKLYMQYDEKRGMGNNFKSRNNYPEGIQFGLPLKGNSRE